MRVVRADLGQPMPSGGVSALVVLDGPMSVGDDRDHPHLAAERLLIKQCGGPRRPAQKPP